MALRIENFEINIVNLNKNICLVKKLLLSIFLLTEMNLLLAQTKETDLMPREKTTFQSAAGWKPSIDIRADVVMVYGSGGGNAHFLDRVKSWRQRGYTTHFMTGIAWGEYQDYFTGQWDGKWHLDEGQKDMKGDTIWHGHMVPYIVPSDNFIRYFCEKEIKPVIDAGIDAIFLEEPEFWARAGYSEAFKREWQKYYGFEWRPQHESAENTYLSNKLKYHLYYQALEKAFTYAKEYGREKGMNVRCYVPTHSLLSYSEWSIVSPEASLASLPCVDGYIAQVWTGTAREWNYYDGKRRERVFESAYLEYGCMESMTAPTGRKMFFLTDPVEDRARDWDDYKRNYQATFTAQLMYPQVNNYEVMPWPARIYEGLYNVGANSTEKSHIPTFYSTQMQVMINTLNDMPLSDNKVSGSQGINVLMANSLMFQRSSTQVEGYEDPQLSNFFGEALPLLKRGVPIGITHLENVGYPETLRGVKVLLMSYSNLKPMDPEAHQHLADWVKRGGVIVYSGRDDDPYQNVYEWWNQGNNHFTAPSQHLFALMGMPENPSSGEFKYGKGRVFVRRQNPKEYIMEEGGAEQFVKTVIRAYAAAGKKMEEKNSLLLQRGPYVIVAALDENENQNPFVLKGSYIDLFDPQLPIKTHVEVKPGEQAFLYDLKSTRRDRHPHVLASASRQVEEIHQGRTISFVSKSPLNTQNIMRVLLPAEPKSITTKCEGNIIEHSSQWDAQSHTLALGFANSPEGVNVVIEW